MTDICRKLQNQVTTVTSTRRHRRRLHVHLRYPGGKSIPKLHDEVLALTYAGRRSGNTIPARAAHRTETRASDACHKTDNTIFHEAALIVLNPLPAMLATKPITPYRLRRCVDMYPNVDLFKWQRCCERFVIHENQTPPRMHGCVNRQLAAQ